MAQFNHRIDLTKSNFPMLTSELGRSVLVSNNKNTPTGEETNEPEIIYMHNVMPTKRGLQSVGYKELIAAPVGVDATIVLADIIPVSFSFDIVWSSGRKVYLGYESMSLTRGLYILEDDSPVWLKDVIVCSYAPPTVANVNGQSYINITSGTTLTATPYYVTGSSPALSLVATAYVGAPFAANFIRGITESFGYMLMWNNSNQVAWSSLINPLDFTPSAVTGAGNGSVEGLKGTIILCAPNAEGFLIYGKYNVVAAIYTGNKQYPFKFVAVDGSRGLEFYYNKAFPSNPETLVTGISPTEMVASDTDAAGHFVYSFVAGLQFVTNRSAKGLLPEVTDFLSGNIVEDFDEATKTFSIATIAVNEIMNKKIAFIANRYLVISYGISELTHAIVYDTALDRIGKLKHTHVRVFEHSNIIRVPADFPNPVTLRDPSKENIAIMDKTGKIEVISFNTEDTTRTGALVLGKYQYHRDLMMHLQRVIAENVDAADSFTFTDMVSLDGRNISSLVTGTETVGTVGYREFYLNSVGKNHSLAFIGEFILNSLELLFTLGGRR